MSWPIKSVSDVLTDVTRGNTKIKQSDYLRSGTFPIVDQGRELVGGFTDDEDSLCSADLPVIVFGDHTKNLKFIDFQFCLGADGTKILQAKDGVDPKYLYYALATVHIPDAGYSRYFKYLKEGRIPLPPLEEQKRIAGILDQADALRRLRARALEKLNTLGQAVFQEMFGDPSSVKRARLGDIIEVRSSLDDPKKDENKSLPHVGPEHISSHSGVIDWSSVRTCEEDGVISGKYRFSPDDILFSKIRPYLNKVAISNKPGMCSADMYALIAKDRIASQQYIKYVLSSDDFLLYSSTVSNRANIPKINRNQLLNYNCPLPDIREQEAFHLKINQIEAEASNLQCSLARANNLFASLQSAALQGRL